MRRFVYQKSRIAVVMVILAVVLMIYASAMYDVQVISRVDDGGSNALTTTYSTVTASRGKLLDRNGVELVTSRARYSVTINRSAILAEDNPNDIIYGLIRAAINTNTKYTDNFPVTVSGPFSWRANLTERERNRLKSYLEYFGLDENISASDFIVWLRDHYKIDSFTGINDARAIIGVRWELELRVIISMADYVFADNVGMDFITCVKEANYPGVTVTTKWERVYHTDYAAHILGYVGLMNEEEVEKYTALGYPMDATIGKTGMEAAFEEYLHGVDGVKATVRDADGHIVDSYIKEEPQAGGNVFSSIDIYMQKTAEDALADTISKLNSTRGADEEYANGGAVVVKDVHSGETLTCASYPSYDVSTVTANYNTLVNDPTRPLFNRATLGNYNPGSTFKMVTAFAGLVTGHIGRWTEIEDQGIYTKYSGYQPKCWVYPETHGSLNVVGALANSCNYFFYWLGDTLGIDAITDAERNFGFGKTTGLEIPESPGIVYDVDYKRNVLNDDWYAADTMISAIGQKDMPTPVQLCNYVSSIANDGTLYKMTLLDKVMNEDYTKTLIKAQPEVLKTVQNNEGYLEILREGMRDVVAEGTAKEILGEYPVKVAAKTGTVQSDSGSVNDGVFVCYAPADDPEIAITVVVENGGSGSSIISTAKQILDYYFQTDKSTPNPAENVLN